jgi:hypothetical protein
LSILQNDLQLDLSNWRAASKDRHATNQAAINRISADFAVTPFAADCNAHTVSHVPEKFLIDELQSLLKPWRKGLANGGCPPILFYESFRVRPRKGNGVRFYIQWEQCMQKYKVGLENIIRAVVDVCVQRKFAEKSMLKMQTKARDPVTLSKAIVQLAAVCSAGLPFCQATYNLEGDGFLAPIAHSILHGLNAYIERGITLDGLELAATRVEEIMKPAFDFEMQRVSTLEIELQRAQVYFNHDVLFICMQHNHCIEILYIRKMQIWHRQKWMPYKLPLQEPSMHKDGRSAPPPPGSLTKGTFIWAAGRTLVMLLQLPWKHGSSMLGKQQI